MTKSANSLWREGVTFEFMHLYFIMSLVFPSVLGKRMTDISGDFKNPKIKGLLDRSIRVRMLKKVMLSDSGFTLDIEIKFQLDSLLVSCT